MLKSYGVGGARVYVVEPESMCGGLQHFSVSPRPLGFGFGAKGLGPGLDNYFLASHPLNYRPGHYLSPSVGTQDPPPSHWRSQPLTLWPLMQGGHLRSCQTYFCVLVIFNLNY